VSRDYAAAGSAGCSGLTMRDLTRHYFSTNVLLIQRWIEQQRPLVLGLMCAFIYQAYCPYLIDLSQSLARQSERLADQSVRFSDL